MSERRAPKIAELHDVHDRLLGSNARRRQPAWCRGCAHMFTPDDPAPIVPGLAPPGRECAKCGEPVCFLHLELDCPHVEGGS